MTMHHTKLTTYEKECEYSEWKVLFCERNERSRSV